MCPAEIRKPPPARGSSGHPGEELLLHTVPGWEASGSWVPTRICLKSKTGSPPLLREGHQGPESAVLPASHPGQAARAMFPSR